jgi:hypothetical protein
VAIELSDELIELETRAWAEIQAQALTVETAHAVQSRLREESGGDPEKRLAMEMELKKRVRHPEG